MTTAEQVAGFCYLPFFVFLLSWLLRYCSGLLDLGLTDLQRSLLKYVIDCAAAWIIFRRFLTASLRAIRFWELVQALILGLALYVAGKALLDAALRLLEQTAPAYRTDLVMGLPTDNTWITWLCCLVLTPVVEEAVFRGLVFGTVRRKSRVAAYAVMVLAFALCHSWPKLAAGDLSGALLAAAPYLPAGIALGWTYEKAGTVWAPIFLHMAITAFSLGLLPG